MILPGTEWEADLLDLDEEAAYRDVWESNVYQLGRDELDGACVVDIGSNIGLFTAYALTHGATGVVAVDPIAAHHERAAQMLGHRGDVLWIVAAAGDGGTMTCGPGRGVTQTMVPAQDGIGGITLDPLVAHFLGERRVIVKVDCEGCEYDLIAAASDATLARVWRFVMEWHGQMDARRQSAEGRIGRMVERLIYTHSVTVYGDPNHGGMLYAYRY